MNVGHRVEEQLLSRHKDESLDTKFATYLVTGPIYLMPSDPQGYLWNGDNIATTVI